jgi:hypothetical protein
MHDINLSALLTQITNTIVEAVAAEVERRIAPRLQMPTTDQITESLGMMLQQAEWFRDMVREDALDSYDFSHDINNALDHYDYRAAGF